MRGSREVKREKRREEKGGERRTGAGEKGPQKQREWPTPGTHDFVDDRLGLGGLQLLLHLLFH